MRGQEKNIKEWSDGGHLD